MAFDIIYLADIRFPGGTSTALKYELRACAAAGLTTGLIPVASPLLARNRPPNAKVLSEIKRTGTIIIPRDEVPRCRLALLYHPTLLSTDIGTPPRFKADLFGVVAHQPPRDRFGVQAYQVEHWARIARDYFRHELTILPVSQVVRNCFEAEGLSDFLSHKDWNNLIDPDDFPHRDCSEIALPIVVGRHSRPGPEKWPEKRVALAAYPDNPRYIHRFLGIDRHYLEQFESVPANWHALPFSDKPVSAFLRGLDVFSYFHSAAWIEAFGYTVLEALATGLPTILPHYLRDIFEDAAEYCAPHDAPELYDRIHDDAAVRQRLSHAARSFATARHGLGAHKRRFEEIVGKIQLIRPVAPAVRAASDKRPIVLSITSNGIGLGHVARQLAIAKALGRNVKVIFFSLSEAISVAKKQGYMAEFRPFHRRLGCDIGDWNRFFYKELCDALAFYKPHLVLFDGSAPYTGLLDALARHPSTPAVWVRRGLWRFPDPNINGRGARFDLIIEPGEICAPIDPGHAHDGCEHWVGVDPVIMTHPVDLLSRAEARRLLEIPADALVGLVQLGSGRNFDMSIPRRSLQALVDRTDQLHLVEAHSPIGVANDTQLQERLHNRRVFPLGLYLNAFDFAVSAAGYNSFHEMIAAALPTIFIPNTNPEMDLQESRSDYGARSGWNLTCDASDPFAIEAQLEEILQPDVREELRENCFTVPCNWQGADQIASLLRVVARLPDDGLRQSLIVAETRTA